MDSVSFNQVVSLRIRQPGEGDEIQAAIRGDEQRYSVLEFRDDRLPDELIETGRIFHAFALIRCCDRTFERRKLQEMIPEGGDLRINFLRLTEINDGWHPSGIEDHPQVVGR